MVRRRPYSLHYLVMGREALYLLKALVQAGD